MEPEEASLSWFDLLTLSDDYGLDLERQSRAMILPLGILSLFGWLPFIPLDLHLYPQLPMLVYLRLGLTLAGLLCIVLHFVPYFRTRQYWLIAGGMVYLQIATGIIVGLVAGDPVYLGGYCLVLLFIPLMPLKKRHALIMAAASLSTLAVVGGLSGMKFNTWDEAYSLTNLIVSILVTVVAVFILDGLRRRNLRKTMMITQRITELDRAGEALKRSRDELSAVNERLVSSARQKDEFLASMSHELRTPLTGILGITEALQEEVYGPLNERQSRSMHLVEASGQHLLSLINDMLDLSKIEAQQMALHLEPCSAGDVCRASLSLVKGMANKKHLKVDYDILPPAIILQADSLRLKQMLVNLLSNAIKFTPQDGCLGLNVQGDPVEGVVRFTVWDRGAGIAPEDLNRLFRAYSQLESSRHQDSIGTGLGLSLVLRMADLHGGGVSVESSPGEGSRFTLLLPWHNGQPPESEATSGEMRLETAFAHPILDAGYLTRSLNQLGVVCAVHSLAENAVERVAAFNPLVILLDTQLPHRSGWEVLTALQADARTVKIPVIMTSMEDVSVQAAKAGAAGCLHKPFNLASLRVALDKAVGWTTPNHGRVLVIAPHSTHPLLLVVNDNDVTLGMLKDYLDAQGYRTAAAASGLQALEKAASLQPDLILMDIQMPGVDGLETTRQIRAHTDLAKTAIIALTALAMPGERERCLQAGVDEYLTMPVNLKLLVETIEKNLKK